MLMSVLQLMESDYPVIAPENAIQEALRLADEITADDPAPLCITEDFSYISGALGTAVFLCAALRFQKDPAKASRYRSYVSAVIEGVTEAPAGTPSDLSLSSGLSGTVHALLLLRQITDEALYPELPAKALDVFLSCPLPLPAGYSDLYLGTAGCIAVLCELIENSSSLPLDFPSKPLSTLIKRLVSGLERLLSERKLFINKRLLWDPVRTGKAVSGLGHGMLGIGAVLLRGAQILQNVPEAVSNTFLTDLKTAAQDALCFELEAYQPSLTEWPDLRPKSSLSKSLHGICSGAPGIGLGLLSLSETTETKEVKDLLSLSQHSCLNAPMRETDHLCCGKASLVEYFLVRNAKLHSQEDYEAVGRILSFMCNERLRQNSGRYRFSPVLSETDSSLFFGSAGIGYEYLRYALPSLPPILP